MVHLLKNPKLVFAAVLLGFQVQLLSAPTFSSGHGEGAEIRQQSQGESEVVEIMNPEKPLQPEKQFEEELEKAIDEIRAEMNEQLLIYQKKLDDIFKSQVEQAREYQEDFKADIDRLLKKTQEDAGQVKATLTEAQEDAGRVKATLTKAQGDAGQVEEDLTKSVEQILESKISQIRGQIGFIVILVGFISYCLGIFLLSPPVNSLFNRLLNKLLNLLKFSPEQLESRVNQRIDEKYKDLESKISKMQGQIKTIAIFGSIATVLTITLLFIIGNKISNPIDLSPESLGHL